MTLFGQEEFREHLGPCQDGIFCGIVVTILLASIPFINEEMDFADTFVLSPWL